MITKSCALFFMILLSLQGFSQVNNANEEPNSFPAKTFAIRTNIPTWLLGIPSLGVSYRTSERFEIAIDGAFSAWKYTRNHVPRHWENWNIAPQVRTYVNADKSAYLGLQYTLGSYNMSSQQGKFQGGGITIGKQYYVSKKMRIDLGLTFGYLKLSERESYEYINNVYYRRRTKEDSNYWGPTSMSIRLSRKVN